jgi:tripartite-type tricarboxylate transporter receptor subunit TctC
MVPYLEKYLPGNPKILVYNKPGAGGINGTNYFYQHAKKDGTWIYVQSTSAASSYMLGDPRIQYKLDAFEPVLNSPRGGMQYVRKDFGLAQIKNLKDRIERIKSFPIEKRTYGGQTPISAALPYRVALSMLGIEVNSVWGMRSNGEMAVAFERGEFQLSFDSTISYFRNRKNMIDSGLAVPLFTLGNIDETGKLTRDPAAPDVPTFNEYYVAVYGKEPSGPGYQAFIALMGVSVPLSKSLLLPPGTPKEAVEVWRTAAHEMLNDEEFKTKAKIEFGPYQQLVGDQIKQIFKQSLSISPESRAWLAKYVKVRYDVELPKKND